MIKYLAGVLSVIAVGLMLIAYGLLVPRTVSLDPQAASLRRTTMQPMEPTFASGYITTADRPYIVGTDPDAAIRMYPGRRGTTYRELAVANRYTDAQMPALMDQAGPAPVVSNSGMPRRRVVERVVSRPRRNWKRTAAVIGGSSAAAAGLGAIFGGKKGALIGAAIGGGASTIYETTRNR
jgi:hypothetical protein